MYTGEVTVIVIRGEDIPHILKHNLNVYVATANVALLVSFLSEKLNTITKFSTKSTIDRCFILL